LGKLIRAGYSPLEIPVAYKSRGFDEGKKIRVFRDPFAWILAILRCRYSARVIPRDALEHAKFASGATPGT